MSQVPLNIKTWMTLGRVSNLPTVWTNTLAAALLASSAGALAPPSSLVWLLLLAALSLLYLAGMLLNDLLDADWDQQHHNPTHHPGTGQPPAGAVGYCIAADAGCRGTAGAESVD